VRRESPITEAAEKIGTVPAVPLPVIPEAAGTGLPHRRQGGDGQPARPEQHS